MERCAVGSRSSLVLLFFSFFAVTFFKKSMLTAAKLFVIWMIIQGALFSQESFFNLARSAAHSSAERFLCARESRQA